MATNIAKLKSRKGAPPAAEDAPDVIAPYARRKAPLRPLQVRVPKTIFEEFSEQAGREYGFTHGAKEAALPQNVASIQSAKHVSMIACKALRMFSEKALSNTGMGKLVT